jgi:hypothetical protein
LNPDFFLLQKREEHLSSSLDFKNRPEGRIRHFFRTYPQEIKTIPLEAAAAGPAGSILPLP